MNVVTGGSSGPVEGKFWPRGPNLPPFSALSADLGHFILKLLNFDIYFLFYVNFLCLFRIVFVFSHTLYLYFVFTQMAAPHKWVILRPLTDTTK